MTIVGKIKKDRSTKNLEERLNNGEIAIIDHEDIDELSAYILVNKQVSAVINCKKYTSGRFPNRGTSVLEKNLIPIFEVTEGDLFGVLQDGDEVEIYNDIMLLSKKRIAKLLRVSSEVIEKSIKIAKRNMGYELDKFIENTMNYASKEKNLVLGNILLPNIKTVINDKHVLIVTRGQNYLEDLEAMSSYIEKIDPVLIGVDGGGDALLKYGLIPDIIIGDMDSVSDNCLLKSKEIIVHAYADGFSPGMKRISSLKLKSFSFASLGTSEDIAMLLAYEKNAKLIVTIGSHSNIIDFLEKGRNGMASTFLVRLKIGDKLIDAKGVNMLNSYLS
ncbi:MAG: thiamin pyrophosphokinase [Alkaliphilus sp.]|nr:hypothetical protein [Alkaliphilus sp. AH-315-G20]PHS36526.1 MAG: thiamin pyrophosphokinase [Alkaliphilus sp.]